MDFPFTDDTRFDERQRVFSEQRMSIPRERLKDKFALDTTLAYHLAALYFATLERAFGPLIKVDIEEGEIRVRTRGRGTTLQFDAGVPEVSQTRAAIGWPIVGGRALDMQADDGGTFTIGAEWDEARANLVVFERLEGYPPSLSRWAYALAQKPAQLFVARRFFNEVVREIAKRDS